MMKQKVDSDNGKSQTVEENDVAIVPLQEERQRENNHRSIAGRPNIDEISRRNEAIANQERKSFYTVAGMIVFLIMAIIFLLYFFS